MLLHLFVDCPNVTSILGLWVLCHKPGRSEWPRWDRILGNARLRFGVARQTIVLNGDRFDHHVAGFYRAMRSLGYDVEAPRATEWCEAGRGDPVDHYIQAQLKKCPDLVAAGELTGVMLVAHDHGYADWLRAILDRGGDVVVAGFLEWMSPALVTLTSQGTQLVDIERDLGGFDTRLHRPLLAA